jgi:hypothetical protein
MRIGKPGIGLQCDTSTYSNLVFTGTVGGWSSGETVYWQNGIYVGDNVFSNNLVHTFKHLLINGWRNGMTIAATNISMRGGSFGHNGTDFAAGTLGYFEVRGFRSENSDQLFADNIGVTSAVSNFTISDFTWLNYGVPANNNVIDITSANGYFCFHNGYIFSGSSGARVNATTTVSSCLRFNGMTVNSPQDTFFAGVGNGITILSEGYTYSTQSSVAAPTSSFFMRGNESTGVNKILDIRDVNNNGLLQLNTIGGMSIREGTNAFMGVSTLVGGTVNVPNTVIASGSRIFLTHQNVGGTVGTPYVSAKTSGSGFVITSTSASDTSQIAWRVVNAL